MRMSRRIGLYGKGFATVAVYGAVGETVTLTSGGGETYTFTANNGSTQKIRTGKYTVYGNKSKYSKTVTVKKDTTRVNAWPDGATIYYWYGYAPNGGWTAVAALPSHYEYQSHKVVPTLSQGTNSMYAKSPDFVYGYNRGGSIYLPKTTAIGSKLYINVTNAYSYGNNYKYGAYLGFGLAASVSGGYTTAAYSDIGSETDTSKRSGTYSVNMSSVSGGSYCPFVSLTSSGSEYNADGNDVSGTPSYVTVNAIYSV